VIPEDLIPDDRIQFRNSRHNRLITAIVVRVDPEQIVVRELRTAKERPIRRDNPHVVIKRL